MDDLTAVRRAVDRLLSGALGPMLDLLADDVEFEVAVADGVPGWRKTSGRRQVAKYFTALGGLPAFWQMDYTAEGRQVIAWGKESFTVEGIGLEGGCEFALVFELDDGRITRFKVIEDLASDNGLDNAEPRTPTKTTRTSFRQWGEEVLTPAVLN